MNAPTITVTAAWDDEHKIWHATSEDICGLHAEAATYEELLNIVPDLVAELLSINGGSLAEMAEIPLEILAHFQSSVHPHHR